MRRYDIVVDVRRRGDISPDAVREVMRALADEDVDPSIAYDKNGLQIQITVSARDSLTALDKAAHALKGAAKQLAPEPQRLLSNPSGARLVDLTNTKGRGRRDLVPA